MAFQFHEALYFSLRVLENDAFVLCIEIACAGIAIVIVIALLLLLESELLRLSLCYYQCCISLSVQGPILTIVSQLLNCCLLAPSLVTPRGFDPPGGDSA